MTLAYRESIELTRGKKMKLAVQMGLLLLCGAALAPAGAAEGYANWDLFDGATEINPRLWLGTERSRLIESGALRFVQRDLGGQADNSGQFNNSWGTNLQNPTAITQMQGVLTVNGFDVTGCAANPGNFSIVQARLVGQFFNAGPGVPTSRVNDVGAVIRLRRDSNSPDAPGLLRVQGTVFQCMTADCNFGTVGLGDVDLGTATIGQAVTLKMEWESASKRFNFYRDSSPVQRVTYTVGDSLAPFLSLRQIGTRTNMANCFSGPRTEGFMDAKFDNISVNASAAP